MSKIVTEVSGGFWVGLFLAICVGALSFIGLSIVFPLPADETASETVAGSGPVAELVFTPDPVAVADPVAPMIDTFIEIEPESPEPETASEGAMPVDETAADAQAAADAEAARILALISGTTEPDAETEQSSDETPVADLPVADTPVTDEEEIDDDPPTTASVDPLPETVEAEPAPETSVAMSAPENQTPPAEAADNVAAIEPPSDETTADEEAPVAEAVAAVEAEPMPEIAAALSVPEADLVEGQAFSTNRREFVDVEDRPVMAIVIEDIGDDGVSRAGLGTFTAPLTFGLSPLLADVGSVSQTHRRNGFEVVLLLPDEGDQVVSRGQKGEALERMIGGFIQAVPGATAIVDRTDGDMSRDSSLAREVLKSVKVTGHGVLTHKGSGLTSVDQLADEEGVPAASIFRLIDQDPDPKAIETALDRAVLEASKTGVVIVMGRSSPETVRTLLVWLSNGGASTVTVAPVSAAIEKSVAGR